MLPGSIPLQFLARIDTMSITYGVNLTKIWGPQHSGAATLMKAYTTHKEKSEVFLSYQHSDKITALGLARGLDSRGRRVFIDVHDDTLLPEKRIWIMHC